MKYAILGDIHSNLEALDAVLLDAENNGCKNYICTGDIIGYGINPKECLNKIREKNFISVKGNHESELLLDKKHQKFTSIAKDCINWTKNQLSEEDINFIKNFKLIAQTEYFTIVHSSLNEPEKWLYINNELKARENFCYQTKPVCFYGHTHVPKIYSNDGIVNVIQSDRIRLKTNIKYLINCGSVGQPRDRNWKASYCIYDVKKKIIEIKRVDYDLEKTKKKIFNSNLPNFIAERLEHGK